MAKYRFSFQLYCARKSPPVDAHLRTLADIGFDAVEPYGDAYAADPKGFRAKCNSLGLTVPTCHIPFDDLDKTRDKTIETAKVLGLETLIIPAVGRDQRTNDVAGWKALGGRLAAHADALNKAGLKLAWHNHAFEYVTLPDGSRPIEHLLAPANVLWEADLGWIVRAGADPATELARFPGKVTALHVKALAPAGVTVDDGWTDIGSGTIDWRKLWPSVEKSGSDLLVFEHDNPSDWKKFAENSYKFLAGLVGRKKG